MNGPPDSSPRSDAIAERRHALLFLVSGCGLLGHILLPIPLPVTIAISLAAAVALVRWIGSPGVALGRFPGRLLVRTGFIAAALALVAYDGSRLALSEIGGFAVGPFEAFPHFGAALVGSSAPEPLRQAAGVGFHVTNALAFGVAYVLIARDRRWLWGVVWGLWLEVMMLGLYPRWLQIRQLEEFVTMSVVGHIAYGATLGIVAQRRLTTWRAAQADPSETAGTQR